MAVILIIGRSYRRAVQWCQDNGHPPPNRGPDSPIYASDVNRIRGLLPDQVVDLGAESRLREEANYRLARRKVSR